MNATALNFLKELLAKPTPSGYEQPGQKVVAAYMEKYADSVRTDVNGSVHGVLNPKGKLKVMLAGHCDEIGLMVMHVDDKGFIYFSAIGGVNVPLLQGERVLVHTKRGDVPGVIGVKPIHLMDAKERETGQGKIEELWIDIGAKDKKDALKVVELGDPVTIDAGWIELRNGLIACRGFDDRIGSFIVADVLRLLQGARLNVAVHAVATTMEELGLRGAHTAAFGVDPDIGIAVDVGFGTDFPGINAKKVGEAKLGEGPILHRGPNFNPHVLSGLEKTAKGARVKVQQQPIPRGSGTDANAIQMTRAGVAAALISVPNRYMHSPVEVISLKDAENTVKLIAEYIKSLKGNENLIP
jgi:endoglucanase